MSLKYYLFPLLTCLMLMPAMATTSDYQVQIGDMLKITLPGEASLNAPRTIDRQGRILLPEIGTLVVNKLTVKQIEILIKSQLRHVLLDTDALTVHIHKKQLLVTVRGYVNQPGEYVLPANAAIQIAIHRAGGLRKGAQLDRMQLIRDKQTVTFNYKSYLDTGDSGPLPALKSMDALFIPASPMTGNIEVDFDPAKMADGGDAANERLAIKVFGEVNSPGSFSYRKSMNIIDLLMRAGGVTRYAGVEKIRIITSAKPILFNLKDYLDTGNEDLLPKLIKGATVFVPIREEQIKTGAHTVYIMGEVDKPGAYEGNQGVSFMDILANAGGPTRFADSRQVRILKADGAIVPFDLTGYTEGNSNISLPEISIGDAIFFPEKSDMNEKSWLIVAPDRAVRVIGAVMRPGRIEWSDEMSLLDLLAHVGGPTSVADTNNIELVIPQANGATQSVQFDLNAFIREGLSDKALPQISAGSTLMIHELPQDPSDNKSQWVRQAAQKSIYIFGQVGSPGRYMFSNEMSFLDILAAADGPTEKADLRNIRINHRDKQQRRVSKLNLALYFETGDDDLIPVVKTGDTIYIPEKERLWLDTSKETTIRVLGAINQPGRYRFEDSMTLLDLLAQAGGANSDAYIENITVVNLSCCKDQARTFNLSLFSKTGNFNALPVLRAGDTVYIPYRRESNFVKFQQGLGDVIRVVSIAALFGII